jgi:large subunit ribosomal protein L25
MHEKAPVLQAQTRSEMGSRQCNRLRSKGKLPAVVYGRGKEPVSISLDQKQSVTMFLKGEKVFRLDMPGTKNMDEGQMVLLRELQYDYLGTNVVHADLTRVSLTDRVHTSVAIHLVGEAIGLKTAGAILMHPVGALEIECAVQDIPDFIEVSVATLDVGMGISAADVKLPIANMKLITDKHAMVAQIVVQAEVATAEAGAVDGAAAPEVLTAKKAEGDAAKAPAGGKDAKAPAAGAKPAAGGAAKK